MMQQTNPFLPFLGVRVRVERYGSSWLGTVASVTDGRVFGCALQTDSGREYLGVFPHRADAVTITRVSA